MRIVVGRVGASGCTTILEAGAIPVIFDCLRSWPDDSMVVMHSCETFIRLPCRRSAAMKQAMRDVPDCEALLRAAQTTGFDKGWNKDSLAAKVLHDLGLYVVLHYHSYMCDLIIPQYCRCAVIARLWVGDATLYGVKLIITFVRRYSSDAEVTCPLFILISSSLALITKSG
jgi:hypothetical protein